jgi:hypothetical protein
VNTFFSSSFIPTCNNVGEPKFLRYVNTVRKMLCIILCITLRKKDSRCFCTSGWTQVLRLVPRGKLFPFRGFERAKSGILSTYLPIHFAVVSKGSVKFSTVVFINSNPLLSALVSLDFDFGRLLSTKLSLAARRWSTGGPWRVRKIASMRTLGHIHVTFCCNGF